MVFFSNRTNTTIRVSVTSGGRADQPVYTIFHNHLETHVSNIWARSGNETAIIKFDNGKAPLTLLVGKDDHVILYDDCVETFQSRIQNY
jgi:hypothetical protein